MRQTLEQKLQVRVTKALHDQRRLQRRHQAMSDMIAQAPMTPEVLATPDLLAVIDWYKEKASYEYRLVLLSSNKSVHLNRYHTAADKVLYYENQLENQSSTDLQ